MVKKRFNNKDKKLNIAKILMDAPKCKVFPSLIDSHILFHNSILG